MAVTSTDAANSTHELTQADKEFFHENGFVRYRNMIPSEEASRLHQLALQHASGQKRHPDYKPGGLSVVQQLGHFSHLQGEESYNRLLSYLQPMIEQLMGCEACMWTDQIVCKPAQSDVWVSWHQDYAYWCDDENPNVMGDDGVAITCWIALSNVTPEMGPLNFVPGSHRNRMPHLRVDKPTNSYNVRDRLYLDPEALEPYMDQVVTRPLVAGDCTFHHVNTAHASSPNSSTEPRVGWAMHFWQQEGRDMKAREASVRQHFAQTKFHRRAFRWGRKKLRHAWKSLAGTSS